MTWILGFVIAVQAVVIYVMNRAFMDETKHMQRRYNQLHKLSNKHAGSNESDYHREDFFTKNDRFNREDREARDTEALYADPADDKRSEYRKRQT